MNHRGVIFWERVVYEPFPCFIEVGCCTEVHWAKMSKGKKVQCVFNKFKQMYTELWANSAQFCGFSQLPNTQNTSSLILVPLRFWRSCSRFISPYSTGKWDGSPKIKLCWSGGIWPGGPTPIFQKYHLLIFQTFQIRKVCFLTNLCARGNSAVCQRLPKLNLKSIHLKFGDVHVVGNQSAFMQNV